MKKILLPVFIIFLLTACESESPLVPENDLVVVRAYLYAGEPVTDIRLTSTYSITSEDTVGQPVNDAKVTLIKNGVDYPLTPTPGDSGFYHYAGNSLQVYIGDRFEIAVEYFGRIATGETVIPEPPKNVRISKDEFVIQTGARFDTSSVTITWDEETDDTFFFVTIENREPVLAPINEQPGGLFGQRRTFRSRPQRQNFYRIRRFDLAYRGKHQVRVYKINPEYAKLYELGLQDSRNLNEPETNIKNGLGIFSGFSSRSLEFTVVSGQYSVFSVQ
jgi:hypothetical protein